MDVNVIADDSNRGMAEAQAAPVELLKLRRHVDEQLKIAFIKQYGEQVKALAENFSEVIQGSIRNKVGTHFYLKGSNALKILQNQDPESDYDFQFVPSQEVYDNWNNRFFEEVDQCIRNSLKQAARSHGGVLTSGLALEFNKSLFSADEIKKADSGGLLENLVYEGFSGGECLIGVGHERKTFFDVLKDKNYNRNDNRMKLKENNFAFEKVQGLNNGLYLYANYTIPGFLLYRLVYSCKYQCEYKGKIYHFRLKSEIIDVSVPRAGSPERYMAQAGVVTNFRTAGKFVIPGWGYHFYENINLLQEIEAGTSQGVDKKLKRQTRLMESIKNLLPVNEEVQSIWGEKMEEPFGDSYSKVCGYEGAVNYHLGLCDQLYSDDNFKKLAARLKDKMKKETMSHLITVAKSIVVNEYTLGDYMEVIDRVNSKNLPEPNIDDFAKALAELFTTFRFKRSRDVNIILVSEAKKVVDETRNKLMLSDASWEILTPLKALNDQNGFQILFAVANNKDKVKKVDFNKLDSHDVVEVVNEEALITLHAKGGAFWIIITQRQDGVLIKSGDMLPKLLSRCILYSQRLALARCMESAQ